MGNTILGVVIMLVATSMTNVGAVLQKKAVDALPPFDKTPLLDSAKAVLRTPLWLVGWLMATTALVGNMVALGLADISVIQPLNGFGLVVLALFSRAYLGERLTGLTLAGVGFVIGGVVIVGAVAPASRAFVDPGELLGVYLEPRALATLVGLVFAAGMLAVLARRVERVAGVLFALAAATCSVVGLTFSKGFFGLITLQGFVATLRLPGAWLLLGLLLTFSITALALQQLSFQRGRAVVVTSVFAATGVALPLVTGLLVFAERLQGAVWLAAALIVVGVVLLGRRVPEASSAADDPGHRAG